jgi:hypothetical protein
MSSFDRKIEELNNKNKKTLDELFGLFGKKNKSEKEPGGDIIKFVSRTSYILNGNPIEYIEKGVPEDWMGYDWVNGKLSWLTKAEFRARKISVDFQNEKLLTFWGDWKSGEFKEGEFAGNGSRFLGGTFIGEYIAPYSTWKTVPNDFLDGKWYDGENGLLGLKNIYDLRVVREGANNVFNILAVPPGRSIKINSFGKREIIISVIKRLDRENSNFKFEVYDSLNESSQPVILPWRKIRGNSDEEFISNTVIDIKNTKSLPVFGLNLKEGIQSVEIISSPDFGTLQSKEEEPEAVDFDFKFSFGKKGWGSNNIYSLNSFNIKTDEQKGRINKFKEDVKSGRFFNNLALFKKMIEQGRVDGYGKYPELAFLFPKQIGSTYKNQDQKRDKIMAYFSDFSGLIIDNLSSEYISGWFENKIKTELGLGSKGQSAKPASKSSTKKVSVKKPKEKPAKTKKRIVPGKPLNESLDLLKKEIRDIINNNL